MLIKSFATVVNRRVRAGQRKWSGVANGLQDSREPGQCWSRGGGRMWRIFLVLGEPVVLRLLQRLRLATSPVRHAGVIRMALKHRFVVKVSFETRFHFSGTVSVRVTFTGCADQTGSPLVREIVGESNAAGRRILAAGTFRKRRGLVLVVSMWGSAVRKPPWRRSGGSASAAGEAEYQRQRSPR